jgi:hypothetical protein
MDNSDNGYGVPVMQQHAVNPARRLTDFAELDQLSRAWNGARVDAMRLHPDAGQLTLTLEVTRADFDHPITVRHGLVTRRTAPWVKSRITIRGVQDADVQRFLDRMPDDAPLFVAEQDGPGHRLTVSSGDGIRLVVTLRGLESLVEDLSGPVEPP